MLNFTCHVSPSSFPEDGQHLFQDDEGKDENPEEDHDVHPRAPGGPDDKRAAELDYDEEAYEAEDEEVLIADADRKALTARARRTSSPRKDK